MLSLSGTLSSSGYGWIGAASIFHTTIIHVNIVAAVNQVNTVYCGYKLHSSIKIKPEIRDNDYSISV